MLLHYDNEKDMLDMSFFLDNPFFLFIWKEKIRINKILLQSRFGPYNVVLERTHDVAFSSSTMLMLYPTVSKANHAFIALSVIHASTQVRTHSSTRAWSRDKVIPPIARRVVQAIVQWRPDHTVHYYEDFYFYYGSGYFLLVSCITKSL